MADAKEADSPEKDKKVLYVRLDKELHDKFAKIAKKQNRKLTNMAEHLIQLYIEGKLVELPESSTSQNDSD
jgi:predicted transcriptional regulator